MAMNRYPNHPWRDLPDFELFQSVGLYGEDLETGKKGFNLAAIMLLGRDDVIKNVSPTCRTDSLLRKVNVDRYDDRLIVETNLIESYDQLMGFAEKHLWDKFYLENDVRISLRNAIAREMLVNTLIHREFTSTYIAQFIIENDKMTVSNANRAESGNHITPENLKPNPKNPTIAAFFRNIGLADELGSGVGNLYKYGLRYSGKEPELIDGDIFKIIVPLDNTYSFDAELGNEQTTHKISSAKNSGRTGGRNELQQEIISLMQNNPSVSAKQIAEILGIDRRNAESHIRTLKKVKLIEREGATKNGRWVVKV